MERRVADHTGAGLHRAVPQRALRRPTTTAQKRGSPRSAFVNHKCLYFGNAWYNNALAEE
jgi:hypothetical protein